MSRLYHKITKFIKWCNEHNKTINWLNIQQRYDLYNEYFYDTRKDNNEQTK